ncbi:VOC family protein [Mucilaginibacter segetis]|uniref:VOC family protein n=1 Tax=Mucilaginibacter segetis TaxID=2793071 RepID=A0A934PRV4_9SPHI|nr:VOC family protein [Mucilaginibacter segetis]MBK0378086.1 VOC family protein [Mucilaginibacter segetis]
MEKLKVIPEGYQAVMPYLILKDAGSFIDFMKEVFGAELKIKHMRDEKLIMHAELDINGSIIMLADSTDTYKPQNSGMFIYVDDCDSTYKKAINSGAKSIFEPADQSYGRSGGVSDPAGNTWWITSAS